MVEYNRLIDFDADEWNAVEFMVYAERKLAESRDGTLTFFGVPHSAKNEILEINDDDFESSWYEVKIHRSASGEYSTVRFYTKSAYYNDLQRILDFIGNDIEELVPALLKALNRIGKDSS